MNKKNKLNISYFYYFLATGFGFGKIFIFPGTIGTILSIFIWSIITIVLPKNYYWIFIIITFLIGIFICNKTVQITKKHDDKCIIWDEFVGMWLILIMTSNFINYKIIITSIIIFRILDIFKPHPIKWIEKNIKGGLGIMLDDIVASSITIILINLIHMIKIF
ncbi:MAG: phosphatidylglycerophosphatase A [Arsenophonus sp.]|nr:MAG: phosphatidylglycerophosphatase A [Arsenophonus sp.]